MKFIYVALSKCKKVIKVGSSYTPSQRIPSLKVEGAESFRMLFHSSGVSEEEAKIIEQEVTKQFKEYIIQGKEWYSNLKPILIIEYLLEDLGLKPYAIEEYQSEFTSWGETYKEYKAFPISNKNYPLIKEKPSKGLFAIRFVNEDRFDYICFCNYGDASKFYYAYKLHIEMADTIINDLYNITPPNFNSLSISTSKDIYSLRHKITESKETLLKLLKLTEI